MAMFKPQQRIQEVQPRTSNSGRADTSAVIFGCSSVRYPTNTALHSICRRSRRRVDRPQVMGDPRSPFEASGDATECSAVSRGAQPTTSLK